MEDVGLGDVQALLAAVFRNPANYELEPYSVGGRTVIISLRRDEPQHCYFRRFG